MWERVSNLASFVTGEDGDEGGVPPTSPESPPHAAIGGDPTEAELQQMEQERLIVHLKEMIRQGEKTTIERDAELKKVQAEFSKFRLQSKSKIASLSVQADQAHKSMSESMERASVGSDESSSTMASEASSSIVDQKSRARNLVLKKRISDKDRKIAEKDRALEARGHELEAKTRIIAERDAVVDSVRAQLEQQGAMIERLQGQLTTDGAGGGANDVTRRQLETRMDEMIAHMVHKDNQIVELTNEITERDKKVMDLQECVSEKDEVIRGRNEAVRLLKEDSRQAAEGLGLQQGREQEAFAEVLQAMEQRLMESKELTASKAKIIEQLKSQVTELDSKLRAFTEERVQMERVIADQEETIRVSLAEPRISTASGEQDTRLSAADACLAEQDEEIRQLRGRLEESAAASSDVKFSKFKALAGSKIKALEKEIEELKQVGDLTAEVASLKNHVAELEEEKGTMQLMLLDLEDKQSVGATSSSPSLPDLQLRLSSLETDHANLSQINVRMETELQELNRLLDEARLNEADLNSSVTLLNNQLEECNKELVEKSRIVTSLEDQLMHVNNQLQESNKELKDKSRTIAVIEDQMKRVSVEAEESNKELAERAKVVAALEGQIGQLVDVHRDSLAESDADKRVELDRLLKELTRVESVTKELRDENIRLKTIADESEVQRTRDISHQDRCSHLEREFELIRGDCNRKDAMKADDDRIIMQLTHELSAAKSDLGRLTELLHSTEELLEIRNVQFKDLSAALAVNEELVKRFSLELEQKDERIEQFTSNLTQTDDTVLPRLVAAESAVAERDVTIRTAAAALEEMNSKISEMEAEIAEKDELGTLQQSDIISLSGRLQVAVAEREKLAEKVLELAENKESGKMLLAEKEMRFKDLLTDIDRSSEENQSLKAGLDIAAGQNRFLQESLEKLEKQISEKDQRVCALQDDVKAKTGESVALASDLERLRASLDEGSRVEDTRRNKEVSSLNVLVAELRSVVDTAMNDAARLQSEDADLRRNLEAAEKKIADRDRKIDSLSENYQEEEAQLVSLTEELEKMRGELETQKDSLRSLEAIVASKAEEVRELTDAVDKKDAKKKKVPTATLR